MNDFWDRMQGVSEVMTNLENEHKKWFSHEEELKLLEYKQNFIKSVLFWEKNAMSEEEKEQRIGWEYGNMFMYLANMIDSNVDEYNQIEDDEEEEEYE